ncbi:glycosyltransferase family protein [Flavilitoribacter nigricans]|uniref:Uncharacterized protein n=1 Tax=Flavilitoribacter nigricans (strain ATCC 23147 / DSM 23189 / NBRC 102662 / NCIMB 1420 / SS-2) TaxID=1122177 RepID=A0A2D0N841_FLAN2|nr:glycosyltransferase family 39 protein [Flavilitoribacter nigricans]PHN04684.1 hypothetical protein CRP01_19395 [Flavilitoribacter nigricans DSM 23189 = NBRC 102662]
MERAIASDRASWVKFVVGGISLALLCWVVYKAVTTSFTHDESFTTLHFFPQGEWAILLYQHPFTSVITNNHILNTLLMKLSESIFGFSEWSLRLPNILALLPYLYFGYRLCRRLPVAWMQLAGFLVLIANPYLLDFFGVARGYGLSIGTMIASLYLLIAYVEKPAARYLLGFHLCGILSVMSNFALLNFYVAAFGCFYLLPFWKTRGLPNDFIRNWKLHAGNLLALGLLAALLFVPFRVILRNNTVSFGGKEGFFENTVRSLIERSFYEIGIPDGWINVLGVLACAAILLPAGLILQKWIRRDTAFFERHTALAITNTIAWLIPLMTIVQHHLLGQDYLEERFAIFLYPLWALNLLFTCGWLWTRSKAITTAVLGVYTLGWLLITALNLNVGYYLNWKYDKDTKHVVQLLKDYRPEDGSSRKIGVFHHLEPTLNFYRRWWEMYWMEEFNREPPNAEDDFIFTESRELEALGISAGREVLFRSEETGMVLVK